MDEDERATAMVFAPSPVLTVTIEARPDAGPEIHLHAGGQGIWIARMLATLGLDVRLCAPFGGESGTVLRSLVEREGLGIRTVQTTAENGAYVHDRRQGERSELAAAAPPTLDRHELDELCNVALVEGLEADVAVLGGPDDERVLSASSYRRLAANLTGNGTPVVVDLSGDYLADAVAGAVTVAKASHEDLIADGRAASGEPADLARTIEGLVRDGAQHVIVSRADEPALAWADGRLVEVQVPAFERVDHRGAGDSMTAGVAAALARGAPIDEALRLGAAAGALNTTRHGLATGEPDLIDRLARRVSVRPVSELRCAP
jgi:1-phosphofructokinase